MRFRSVAHVLAASARLCLLLILVNVACSSALAAEYTGEEVKAAFIARFASYVEWPAAAADTPVVIGAIGADDMLRKVGQLSSELRIGGRRVLVSRPSSIAELRAAQILYVSSESLRNRDRLALAALRAPDQTLVVTDRADGLLPGAVINFVQQDRKVRFEVSLIEAERRHLKLNAGLLSVAIRIDGKPRAEHRCAQPGSGCSEAPGFSERAWQFARTLLSEIWRKALA